MKKAIFESEAHKPNKNGYLIFKKKTPSKRNPNLPVCIYNRLGQNLAFKKIPRFLGLFFKILPHHPQLPHFTNSRHYKDMTIEIDSCLFAIKNI